LKGMAEEQSIIGAIIAGGAGRRMGGQPKPLLRLKGRFLIQHVIERLAPQVGRVVLSAAGASPELEKLGLAVVEDARAGRQGPLAGIEAALIWAKSEAPAAQWLAVVPCDVPFLPADLVRRLIAGAEAQDTLAACARTAEQDHPLCAVLRPSVIGFLQDWLAQDRHAVHRFLDEIGAARVEFRDDEAAAFFNINTPSDLSEAEARLS
ncbi:MAG: molybdenum cofactor guanylyltransferase MobA, partial [Alphaproteobacteria bacterium]|nr:molybdenum cofactor guanylyltransferase MobA [Alphaproteobacteria bacterium]